LLKLFLKSDLGSLSRLLLGTLTRPARHEAEAEAEATMHEAEAKAEARYSRNI